VPASSLAKRYGQLEAWALFERAKIRDLKTLFLAGRGGFSCGAAAAAAPHENPLPNTLPHLI